MSKHPLSAKTVYSFWDFWVVYTLVLVFVLIKYFFPGVLFADGLQLQEVGAKLFFSLLLTTAGALLGILVAALTIELSIDQQGGKTQERKQCPAQQIGDRVCSHHCS